MALLDAAMTDLLASDIEVRKAVDGRVYYVEAPAGAKMPYLLVSNIAEVKERERPRGSDYVGTIRCDLIASECTTGRFLMEGIRKRLRSLRCDIGILRDCVIDCGAVVSVVRDGRSQHSMNVEVLYTEEK